MRNEFQAKASEVKQALASGQIGLARIKLDEAWQLTGQIKSFRTIAHALGNEIQGAIFNEYLKSN